MTNNIRQDGNIIKKLLNIELIKEDLTNTGLMLMNKDKVAMNPVTTILCKTYVSIGSQKFVEKEKHDIVQAYSDLGLTIPCFTDGHDLFYSRSRGRNQEIRTKVHVSLEDLCAYGERVGAKINNTKWMITCPARPQYLCLDFDDEIFTKDIQEKIVKSLGGAVSLYEYNQRNNHAHVWVKTDSSEEYMSVGCLRNSPFKEYKFDIFRNAKREQTILKDGYDILVNKKATSTMNDEQIYYNIMEIITDDGNNNKYILDAIRENQEKQRSKKSSSSMVSVAEFDFDNLELDNITKEIIDYYCKILGEYYQEIKDNGYTRYDAYYHLCQQVAVDFSIQEAYFIGFKILEYGNDTLQEDYYTRLQSLRNALSTRIGGNGYTVLLSRINHKQDFMQKYYELKCSLHPHTSLGKQNKKVFASNIIEKYIQLENAGYIAGYLGGVDYSPIKDKKPYENIYSKLFDMKKEKENIEVIQSKGGFIKDAKEFLENLSHKDEQTLFDNFYSVYFARENHERLLELILENTDCNDIEREIFKRLLNDIDLRLKAQRVYIVSNKQGLRARDMGTSSDANKLISHLEKIHDITKFSHDGKYIIRCKGGSGRYITLNDFDIEKIVQHDLEVNQIDKEFTPRGNQKQYENMLQKTINIGEINADAIAFANGYFDTSSYEFIHQDIMNYAREMKHGNTRYIYYDYVNIEWILNAENSDKLGKGVEFLLNLLIPSSKLSDTRKVSMIADDDDILLNFKQILQILFNCLLNRNLIKCFLIIKTEPNHGKSKYKDLVGALFGVGNISSPANISRDNQFLYRDIKDKHVFLEETAKDLNPELLKLLADDTTTTSATLYSDEMQIWYQSPITSLTNRFVKTFSHDKAMLERDIIVEFPNKFIPPKQYDAINNPQAMNLRKGNPDITNEVRSDEYGLDILMSLIINFGKENLYDRVIDRTPTQNLRILDSTTTEIDEFIIDCLDIIPKGDMTISNVTSYQDIKEAYRLFVENIQHDTFSNDVENDFQQSFWKIIKEKGGSKIEVDGKSHYSVRINQDVLETYKQETYIYYHPSAEIEMTPNGDVEQEIFSILQDDMGISITKLLIRLEETGKKYTRATVVDAIQTLGNLGLVSISDKKSSLL